MASLPSIATVRISQRASSSCSECARRKTRCDKEVPCGNCVKRNKAHLCHIVPHVRPKDADRFRQVAAAASMGAATTATPHLHPTAPLPPVVSGLGSGTPGTPPVPPADPRLAHTTPTTVDALALSAFAEVEAIRSTLDGLRSRLTGLESVLVAAFGRLGQDPARCAQVHAALLQQGGGGGHGDGGDGGGDGDSSGWTSLGYGYGGVLKPEERGPAHEPNAVGLHFDPSPLPRDDEGLPPLSTWSHRTLSHPPPPPPQHDSRSGDIFLHPAAAASNGGGLTPYGTGSTADVYPAYTHPPPPPHLPPPAAASHPASSSSSSSYSPAAGGLTLPPLGGPRPAGVGGGAGSDYGFAPFGPTSQGPHPEPDRKREPELDALSRRGEEEEQEGGDDAHESSSRRERSDELREEEVAASLSLEFMALGRNRALTGPQSSAQNAQLSQYLDETHAVPWSSVFDPATLPPHPCALFPTAASLARVLPPYADTQLIMEHALECTGWHHGCIHASTFRAELAEFWSAPEATRFDRASPAWLALLFAQLACGVKHMTREQLQQLGPFGLNDEDMRSLSKTHLDAALACLYRSHFLENHQLHAIQAITILVVTCQDGAFSNLFPMLLSTGICLAQDLGLHRLPSEEAWLASVEGQPLEARAKSLIAYETRKRVFWALTSQDWFSIPYRRTTAVQPTQVTTPLPINAHDEDLMTGVLTNRPPNEYTVVSRLLVWIQVARILQQVFQHIDENPSPSYEHILQLDTQLQQLLDGVPAWFTSDSVHSDRLPANAAWMRTTFIISSSHKVLTLHRAFFRRFEPSRKRALDASRAILREAARVGDSRMWTVPYHISAAASVVCLDLFQRGSPVPVLVEERDEVLAALLTLRSMTSFSAIAARGAALIENLLTEESKLPPLSVTSPAASYGGGCGGSAAHGSSRPSAGKRRRQSDPEESRERPGHPLPSPPSTTTSAASLAHLLASPIAPTAASASPVARPPACDIFFAPAPGVAAAGAAAAGGDGVADLASAMSEGGCGGGGGGGGLGLLGDLSPLPASFMSAFLETGFDPLEGAIVGAVGPGAGNAAGAWEGE